MVSSVRGEGYELMLLGFVWDWKSRDLVELISKAGCVEESEYGDYRDCDKRYVAHALRL